MSWLNKDQSDFDRLKYLVKIDENGELVVSEQHLRDWFDKRFPIRLIRSDNLPVTYTTPDIIKLLAELLLEGRFKTIPHEM